MPDGLLEELFPPLELLELPLDDPLLLDVLEAFASAPLSDVPELLPLLVVGAAHRPLVQRPVQHSVPVVQLAPFGAQEAPLHVPPRQLWLQHSLLVVHDVSSALQTGSSHRLLVQVPLQQSLP